MLRPRRVEPYARARPPGREAADALAPALPGPVPRRPMRDPHTLPDADIRVVTPDESRSGSPPGPSSQPRHPSRLTIGRRALFAARPFGGPAWRSRRRGWCRAPICPKATRKPSPARRM